MGASGVCQKPEVKPKLPVVVGEGEKCQMTVSPPYQVHCEEGLECISPQKIEGASGICQKLEDDSESDSDDNSTQPAVVGEGEKCQMT
eukprot:CAMPEP_0183405788 /NCGR_PEP_ID=MMETSP0370-20130417/16091_1 /TAXON_ID=268820 /ORGANISM="Peridinium aciculiferum, Strain PAER-2" /LENGTH=87 /DNA_ID=CAMNT_0025587835 /DNA_START=1 /DNA_END=260 /DNA_ORIENTATION=+